MAYTYMRVTVFSLALILPGLAHANGFNPFKHHSDNPGVPTTGGALTNSTASVPEPATGLAVGIGLLGLAAWRRYNRP
jgi:hypothetical protein